LIKEQFGVDLEELELKFYIGGKGRVYAYRECEFDDIAKHKGIYFGTLERDGLRLSIEGSFIVGKLARKNVIELDDLLALKWLSGEDIETNVYGYHIVKWKGKDYFLGCGKGNGRILRNFVPKDRRINK
jgi:NOL1/NOP2/fmu family ribosome biogenesis protein